VKNRVLEGLIGGGIIAGEI